MLKNDAGTAQSLTEYDVCVGWCDVMQPCYSRWAYIVFLQAGSGYHRGLWISGEDFKCVQQLAFDWNLFILLSFVGKIHGA